MTIQSSLAEQPGQGFELLREDKKEKAYDFFVDMLANNQDCIGCYYGLASLISDKNNLHYDLENAYKAIHKSSELAKERKYLSELQELPFTKTDIKKLLNEVELHLLEELKRPSIHYLKFYEKLPHPNSKLLRLN